MIKRATIWCITAFAFVFLSQSQAKLPFNAFKNVSNHFHNVYYSPVLGMSALESGIITAIRFAFVDNVIINQDTGLRIFLADQITNPHGTIAKILFPSVTGELGIDTNAQVTLSSHATPEFMATLMVIASKIRQIVGKQPEAVELFLNSVWEDYFFKATGSGKKQVKAGILAEVTLSTTDRNKLKKQVVELFTHISRAIIEEEQGISILPKYSVEQLISAFVCTKLNTRDELEEYIIDLYLKDSDSLIFRALSSSSTSPSVSPFANIALFDLNDEAYYMDVLETTFPLTSGPTSSSSSATSSSGASAPASVITFDANPNLLDALYALTFMPYFYKPTPYINSAPSHGPAGFVEGIDAIINHERGTFSDCNENSLRVLLNLMTFDATKREFNLAFLENSVGPRIKFLKEFFNHYQDVTNVGSTSQTTRTHWNRVVGDLNSFLSVESPPLSSSSSFSSSSSSSSNQDVSTSIARVRYLQGNNELDSGFANVLRVFEKVLGISLLPSFPETGSIDEQEAAILNGFMALFKFIAPRSKVVLNFNNLQSKPGDLAGSMTVTVNDQFQFTLYENNGTHGHIEGIKSLLPAPRDQERLTLLAEYVNVMQNETVAPLILLQKNWQKPMKNTFYNLFSTPIHGNDEALIFLRKLASMEHDARFNSPLKFVLKQIAWDDNYSRQSIFDILESMMQSSYADTIYDGIGYFRTSPKYPIEDVIEKMKNLMYIEFRDESYVNIPNVMPNIKEIFLPKEAQAPLDLSKFPNLERLILNYTNIGFIEFTQPMPYLKILGLPSTITDWSQVRGFENLTALERLTLVYTDLPSVDFTHPMPYLLGIHFPDTLISLKGAENLTAIKRLDLWGTIITSLELKKLMPSLDLLYLPKSIKSCVIHDNQENWEVLVIDRHNKCRAVPGKHTICLPDSHQPDFNILFKDREGNVSSWTPPN